MEFEQKHATEMILLDDREGYLEYDKKYLKQIISMLKCITDIYLIDY